MAKDDPLGDWVPTMALFGGLGVTGFRAAQDMSKAGAFSAPWQRAKDAEHAAEMIRSGFQGRAQLATELYRPDQVASLFHPSGEQLRAAGIPAASSERVATAAREYGYQATRGFIFSHGLEAQVQALIGEPFSRGLNSPKVIGQIMGLHPRGAELFHQRASSYGLPNLLAPIDDRMGTLQSSLQRRLKGGAVENVRPPGLPLSSVSDVPIGSNLANPASRIREVALPGTQAEVLSMLEARGQGLGVSREALSMEVHKLHQQVSQMDGVDVRLLMLRDQANKEMTSGIRVTSRRNGAFIDVPFEQRGGVIHMGEFGQTRAVTRRVAKSSSEIRGLINQGGIQSADDALRLSNPLSLHTLQRLNSTGPGGLSSLGIQTGSGRIALSNYRISRYGDDTSSAVIHYNANRGLNARIAGQMTMAHLEGEAGFQVLKGEVGRALQPFLNPYGGLGPSHAAQPLLNVRAGRLPGSGELGQWVGDPKGQAQAMRGASYYPSEWSGARGKGALIGRVQSTMGDRLPELRVANIQGGLLDAFMLTDPKYAHMSLSSDEILSTRAAASRRHIRQFSASVSEVDEFGRRLLGASDLEVGKIREIGSLMEQGLTQSEAVDRLSRASYRAEVEHLAGLGSEERTFRLSQMAESLAEPGTQRPLDPFASDLVERATRAEYETAASMSRLESGQRAGFSLGGQEVTARGGQTVYVSDFMVSEGQLKLHGTTATEGGVLTKSFGDLKTVTKYADLDPATARTWAAAQHILSQDPAALRQIEGLPLAERARVVQPILDEIREGRSIRSIQALRLVGDIEAVGNAGVKDLAERGLAPMNRSMASELAGLHATGVRAGDEALQAWSSSRLREVGAVWDEGAGRFIVEDDILRAGAAENLNQVRRFEALAESFGPFAHERGPDLGRMGSARTRWTAERYIEDQRASFSLANKALERQGGTVTAEMVAQQETRIAGLQSAAKTGSYKDFRAAAGDDFRTIVGRQLGYGTWNYATAVEGRAAQRLGTGRQASASGQLFGHLRSQNPVMARAADEMLMRTQGAYAPARDLSKAIAYSSLESPVAGAISMADPRMPIGAVPRTAEGLRSPQTAGIFSLNPEVRARSAAQIREAFGLAQGADIVFDAGAGSGQGRNLFYIEEIHDQLTRGQRLPDGSSTLGRYDRTLSQAIQAQGEAARIEATGAHRSRIIDLASHKGGPLSEIDKGKVIGSRQLQAASALEVGLMEEISKRGQIGLFESTVREMAGEMGADADDYIRSLRGGGEAVSLHRWPMSEQMRVTAAQAFSMDQAIESYASRQYGQLSGEQVLREIERLESRDPKSGKIDVLKARAAEAGLEGRSGLAQVVKAEDLAESLIRSMGREAGTSAFFGLDEITKMALLSSTGIDFDADQVGATLFKDKQLRADAAALSRYNLSIVEAFVENSKLGADARLTIDQVLERNRSKAVSGGARAELYQMAERQASYLYQRQELFDELKRAQTPLTEAEVSARGGINTPEAQARMAAEATMGRLEKATIGPLTNQVDFTRAVFREGMGAGAINRVGLMGELLLGALPEVALKARQGGTGQATALAGEVNTILEALSGRPTSGQQAQVGATVGERARAFETAFRSLHAGLPEESLGRLFADNVAEDIIRASDKGGQMGESLLHRMLRLPSGAQAGSASELIAALSDPANTSLASSIYKDSAQGVAGGQSSLKGNVRRGAEVFDDIWSALGKHKKPALIGAGVAISGAMLLGSPGHISEEEAIAGGARHQGGGNPAHPQIDNGNSARLRTGTSVRVRGQSMAEMDYDSISRRVEGAYPGSNISYNVNDQGSSVDSEYVRKLLLRGA